jgi:hypothetical protein
MRDRDAIYQDILRCGRRRAERAWLHCDRRQMQIEQSHLALIPQLLRCDDERRHRHYVEVDAPRFLRTCKRGTTCEFELFWMELAALFREPLEMEPPPMAKVAGDVVLEYRTAPTEPDSARKQAMHEGVTWGGALWHRLSQSKSNGC